MSSVPALKANIKDIVKEYDTKVANIDNAIKDYHQACKNIKAASCVMGRFGNFSEPLDVYKSTIKSSLLESAWKAAYEICNIDKLASVSEKKLFNQSLANPPEFTFENVLATFGDHVINPRKAILNAFAEVFMQLDYSYKSHERVKIGVKGLPKRIILSNASSRYGWGHERLKQVINALAIYEGKSQVSFDEMCELQQKGSLEDRGLKLNLFQNGNGHLYFEPEQLKNINLALAEFYGDVLPDTPDVTLKKENTHIAKDLQFYPTPKDLVHTILSNYVRIDNDSLILEPSCGTGNIMDVLAQYNYNVYGVECDYERAKIAKSKGHKVYVANFLETQPEPKYDVVLMNPPFYGKHYAKHVNHALKFLKDGKMLHAILPITARYEHKILNGTWQDLPNKSFSKSGTNINTTLLTIKK